MKCVTCNKCGWVHMGVTRAYAEDEVKRFNEYFATLSPEKQQEYYNGRNSSISSYEHCMVCGNHHTNFHLSEPWDCPVGCTLNPIISFSESTAKEV